jgi:hypothetical protein
VVAATSYGLIDAGIAGRQQIYLSASRQMACAIVAAGADLYPRADVHAARAPEVPPEPPQPLRLAPVALESALAWLRWRINDYEAERARLLADARARPARSAAPAVDSYTAAQNRLGGLPGGSAKAADSRPALAEQTRARLVDARRQLAQGQALLRRLDGGAAAALRAEGARIDLALHQQLAAAAPPPQLPATVVAKLADLQKGLLQLQSGAEPGSETAADPGEATLGEAVFDGLSDPTRRDLRRFQIEQGVALRQAAQDLLDWTARHQAGQDAVDQLLTKTGCQPVEPPASALPDPVPPGANRPPTRNMGGTAKLPFQSKLSP